MSYENGTAIFSLNGGASWSTTVSDTMFEEWGTSLGEPVDATIAPKKVSRELIANIEMQFGGRFYIDKSGNAVYESKYKRGS